MRTCMCLFLFLVLFLTLFLTLFLALFLTLTLLLTLTKAEADKYDNIGQVNKVTGQIHPFGGLRGDAKALWKAIKQGRETRVRLMTGVGASMLQRLYAEAAVVVWACGYTTNTVPITTAGMCLPVSYCLIVSTCVYSVSFVCFCLFK